MCFINTKKAFAHYFMWSGTLSHSGEMRDQWYLNKSMWSPVIKAMSDGKGQNWTSQVFFLLPSQYCCQGDYWGRWQTIWPILPNVCTHCFSDLLQLNYPFTLLIHYFFFFTFSKTNLYLFLYIPQYTGILRLWGHRNVSPFLFPCLPQIWILKYKVAEVLVFPISLFLVCLHVI